MKEKRTPQALDPAKRPRGASGALASSLPKRPPAPPSGGLGLWTRWRRLLAQPVNGASLAALRICAGLLMVLEAYSLCHPSAVNFGKIPLEVFYTGADVKYNFPYPGFHWLPLLSPRGIYGVVGLLTLSGIMVALGLAYRFFAATLFLSWGYLFAVESTRTYWNSYYYSELLISFLLVWMPAAQRFSIDAWLARRRAPPLQTVPFWTLLLLRAQLVVMYFYGGVAKLNADWLLDAEPVRYHLAHARLTTQSGSFLSAAHVELLRRILQSNGCAYFISYAGALFDLSVGFLLLVRRARIFALILLVAFHATNHFVIFNDIDWFPFLGLTTSLIFLDADWPERVWRWLRRPRLAKPDWRWLVGGGLAAPVVGLALGWKLPATAAPKPAIRSFPAGKLTACFVAAWLVWQALMPLRQFAIPGDARFTWEGLSFSWRLKADIYNALQCDLVVEDPAIVAPQPNGRSRIDWNLWHGEKVIYRSVTPGHIRWADLPEVVVLLEPLIGERIIYNPFSGGNKGRSESESRERVKVIWQELYGRPPEAVLRTFPFKMTISALANRLRSKGFVPKTSTDVLDLVNKLLPNEQDSALMGLLLHIAPFAIEGEPDLNSDASPFLLIYDRSLFRHARGERMRIDPARWMSGSYTQTPRSRSYENAGGVPLVIHTGAATPVVDLREMLSQANLCDREEFPDRPPYISWNYLQELTVSQGMHISMQPFLLREYARHVADLWQKEYGRRPEIHAAAEVSLNGRPFQTLVDPQADLASVPEVWLGHNSWIRNLETARIPGGVISSAPGGATP